MPRHKMATKLLRWTAYAIIATLLLTWTYVLHPTSFSYDARKEVQPEHRIESHLTIRENKVKLHHIFNTGMNKQERVIKNSPIHNLKTEDSPPVINIVQTGLDHPKRWENDSPMIETNLNAKPILSINQLESIGQLQIKDFPASQSRVIQNENESSIGKSKFSFEQSNKESFQVESNDRYKQVELEQAEILRKSTTSNVMFDEEHMKKIELDLTTRRENVKKVCYKYGLGKYSANGRTKTLRYPPSANYDILYIDRPDALTWCPVYKAASTTWLNVLSLLAGARQSMLDTTKDQISTIARKLYPPLEYNEAGQAVVHTTKFMIVRHPFERIVSAYRDKLENLNIGREHGAQHFYEKYGKKIVQKYRKGPQNNTIHATYLEQNTNLPAPRGVEPTFEEFVKYLIDTDLVHYADDHWIPYYLYCTPCYLDYEVIAKFETLDRDQRYLIQKLELENKVNPKWKHLTKGKKTADVVKEYMATISKSDILKLSRKYIVDFEMYNYSFDKYLLHAKST